MPCLTPNVPILILDSLRTTLLLNKLNIEHYHPAYGDSIGLDLYNTGGAIVVPPASADYKTDYSPPHARASKTIVMENFTRNFKNLVPTGLRVAIPHGWVGIIQERGSITKTSLKVRAGVIDPNYTGEIFVNCVNLGTHLWEIPEYSKLPFQLVIVRANAHFISITEDEYTELTTESTRKDGKIGSSDRL